MSKNHRVVIVGSSKFEDRACVFGLLDQLQEMYRVTGSSIERVYSGTFSGVAEFAREWAQLNQVEYKPHNFFHEEKNNPLFDMIDVPDFVLKEDEFFKKGREFLMSEQINMMITMPNADGELGVETKNIMRMAELIELPILEGHLFYQQVLAVRDAEKLKNSSARQTPNTVTKLGGMDRI